MLVALTKFRGTVPKLSAHQLDSAMAQIALNCAYSAETLAPVRSPKLVHTFAAPVLTVYRHQGNWMGFASVVSVAPGPVAQDRLYYTGDGAPKMIVAGITYNLKLPAPATAPTVTNASAPAAGSEEVAWVYTWVTSFGEESPPSPLSSLIALDEAVAQTVGGFAAAPAGRGVTAKRLYRSQTTVTGGTDLFFVAEIPVATTSYVYNAATTPLAEAIPSHDYDPPLDQLQGLTVLPNGIMAAFKGKELYFCEPYQPHAWPIKYMRAVDSDIVGLASFGSSLAVLTRSAPYVAQGVTPDSMVMERIESGSACLSARGIVDFGYSAIYPAPDGLILISEGERQSITTALFSREQWLGLNPTSIIAARYDDRFILVHNTTNLDIYVGGAPADWLPGDAAIVPDTGGPLLTPVADYLIYDCGSPDSSYGDQALSWVRPGMPDHGFTRSNMATPRALYSDQASDDLYFVAPDGVSLFQWESPAAPGGTALWRSKVFNSNAPSSPAAVYVKTERGLVDGDVCKTRIYGNGAMIREIQKVNQIERMPAGRLYTTYEIEIETNVPVLAVYVAESADDILVVLQ